MKNIYHLSFVLFLMMVATTGFSQITKPLSFVGKIIDKNSRQPLEYATISLFTKDNNKLITGGVTATNGRFAIPVKSAPQLLYAKIEFIGYQTIMIREFEVTQGQVDLGVVSIAPDKKMLNEVTVTAEKSQTIFKLDKRVFNVGKDLISAGGSSLDVLNNVPSVNVSIEGAISLRGNPNVQILINGNPSVMTGGSSNSLGAISASMIDRIEVITNPSAKYDAKGTTGIINIVLKKEERRGFNGSITLNTGVPENHSLGLSLSKRTEKLNLFTQLGIGKRMFPSNYRGITIDRNNANGQRLQNDGEAEKHEQFYNLRLGMDYHINPFNIITLAGNFAYEFENEYSDTYYNLLNASEQTINLSQRDESTTATNPKWQYDFQYKKTFADNKDQSLVLTAQGFFFGKDRNSSFKNTTTQGTQGDFEQTSKSNFSDASYSFRLDYTHPFAKDNTLEIGAKYDLNFNANDYEVADLVNGTPVLNPDFTNLFEFDQKVLGIYGTYAYELGKVGLKAGVRVENTQVDTRLITTNTNNQQEYTNVFPSVHLSYKVTKQFSTQVSYSKRIHRPRMWDLNPFTTIRDNLNQSFGNPSLQPEFTDSYEFTAIQNWEKASINVSVFHRRTQDVVNDITQVIDSLTITAPQNVGNSENTGVEVNGKLTPTKWFSLLGDFNWTYFNRNGSYEQTDFAFENTRWSVRLTSKFKLPMGIDAEIRVRYRSAVQELLGTRQEIAFADFGIKKKLWKGRAVVNFSMRDVFSSRRNITEMDQPGFYRYNNRQWGGRMMVLGVSMSFGKGNAMEFSGHKRF